MIIVNRWHAEISASTSSTAKAVPLPLEGKATQGFTKITHRYTYTKNEGGTLSVALVGIIQLENLRTVISEQFSSSWSGADRRLQR